MAYCTPSDVLVHTGVSTDADTIVIAQSMIELFTNRTEPASGSVDVSDRDLYWLKLATCYQVAFMESNTNLFTQGNIKQISQGDLMMTFSGSGAGSALTSLVAPLARKALERCTWTRVRSVRVGSDTVSNHDFPEVENWVDEDEAEWEPM